MNSVSFVSKLARGEEDAQSRGANAKVGLTRNVIYKNGIKLMQESTLCVWITLIAAQRQTRSFVNNTLLITQKQVRPNEGKVAHWKQKTFNKLLPYVTLSLKMPKTICLSFIIFLIIGIHSLIFDIHSMRVCHGISQELSVVQYFHFFCWCF